MTFIVKPVYHSKINIINELRFPGKVFLFAGLTLLISMKGLGQPVVDFSASSITICSGSTDNLNR
jgi:hypothetical protein